MLCFHTMKRFEMVVALSKTFKNAPVVVGSGTNMSDTASDEKFGLGGPCSCSACVAKFAHTTMLCDCTSEKDERTLPDGDRCLSCSQIFESGFETHQSWEEYCSMRNTDEGKKFGAEVEANIAREGPRTFQYESVSEHGVVGSKDSRKFFDHERN